MEAKKMSSRRHFPKSYTSCGFDFVSHQPFDRSNLMTQSYPRTKISEKTNEKDQTIKKMVQKSHSVSSIPTGQQAASTTAAGLASHELTEYRDNYKPFLYGYKVLPVVVSPAPERLTGLVRNNAGQVVIDLGQQQNGGAENGMANGKETVVDGPILVPVEKVLINPIPNLRSKENRLKTRKTEYRAKFRPFSAYVYLPSTGLFMKPKDIDPMMVTQVNDWLYEVTERTAKAAEFSRRSKFGHPIVGADHLEAIYQNESRGPWYTKLRDQNETMRNEIAMINLNKFRRTNGSATHRSASVAERAISSAPLNRRNQSADRTNKTSPSSGSASPTKPIANGKTLNGREPAAAPRRPLSKTHVQTAKRSELGSSPIGKIWLKASPPNVPDKSPIKEKAPTPPTQAPSGPKPPPRKSVGSIKPPSTVTASNSQLINGSKTPTNGQQTNKPTLNVTTKSSQQQNLDDLMSSGIPVIKNEAPTLIPIPVNNSTSNKLDMKASGDQKNTIWSRIKQQDDVGRGFESSLSHESSFSS